MRLETKIYVKKKAYQLLYKIREDLHHLELYASIGAMKTALSVIIPIFNEQGNIKELCNRLLKILPGLTKKYEIIFVDDGSTDESVNILSKLRKKIRTIKIIVFSRNFGHMAAIDAGLNHASGQKIVVIDADLQDPPEVIKEMYKLSNRYDVIYGVKRNRKESPFMKLCFFAFYRVMNVLSTYKMPLDSGTYSLLDKRVADLISELPERNKFFSGLRAWSGFSQTFVVYERDKRFSGNPATMTRLLKLAFDGIFSFSYLPLRISSLMGIALAAVSLVLVVLIIVLRIYLKVGLVGWASTISAILFIGSIQLMSLGIIGEYLGRIYEEVKNRPRSIISKKYGF